MNEAERSLRDKIAAEIAEKFGQTAPYALVVKFVRADA